MTTEEKKEFARLNKGRRVKLARGLATQMEGTLNGRLAESYSDAIQWIGDDSQKYWAMPEDLDPVDGLGPLKFSEPPTKNTPHGAVVTPAGNAAKPVPDSQQRPHLYRWKCGQCGRENKTNGACVCMEPLTIKRFDLERCAEFLNTWTPRPGESTAREREAVTLTGILKAVLWPAKGRDIK